MAKRLRLWALGIMLQRRNVADAEAHAGVAGPALNGSGSSAASSVAESALCQYYGGSHYTVQYFIVVDGGPR